VPGGAIKRTICSGIVALSAFVKFDPGLQLQRAELEERDHGFELIKPRMRVLHLVLVIGDGVHPYPSSRLNLAARSAVLDSTSATAVSIPPSTLSAREMTLSTIRRGFWTSASRFVRSAFVARSVLFSSTGLVTVLTSTHFS